MQVDSPLLLLLCAADMDSGTSDLVVVIFVDRDLGRKKSVVLHLSLHVTALFLGGALAVVGVVNLLVVVVRLVGVTGLEAEGSLLSLAMDVRGCHSRQEGCCQQG